MNRPINTLFLIESLDGKISTGTSNERDFDTDSQIIGIKKGEKQYQDYEQTTDLHSFNSGKVMAKVGMNEEQVIKKTIVSFIVIDNSHLTKVGVENFCKRSKIFYLITSNKKHPAFSVKEDNLEIIFYENKIDFNDLFVKFKKKYGIEKITIQTGGELNSILLRENLIDKISIFIAPVLFGGKDTPTLVDGKSLLSKKDLEHVKLLELKKVNKLKDSFLHLEYDVVKKG
ncbi:MAG: dihydrofolate reductase family protein [Alphaproteobacteria bacterium]|nr:MAG: deaminase [Rickettsiaceae bacterium 4572_127]